MKCVLIPQRNAGDTLNKLFENNYLEYINKLRNKLRKTDRQDSDYSETKDVPIEYSEDPLSKFSEEEILKMIDGNYSLIFMAT